MHSAFNALKNKTKMIANQFSRSKVVDCGGTSHKVLERLALGETLRFTDGGERVNVLIFVHGNIFVWATTYSKETTKQSSKNL
jgi:hypothetical protein